MKGLVLTMIVCTLSLVSTQVANAAPKGNVTPPDVKMGFFMDYAGLGVGAPTWDDNQDGYQIRGKITWPDPSAVDYFINPDGSSVSDADAITAVNAGLAEWQNGPSSQWGVSTGFVAYNYGGTTSSKGFIPDDTNTISWQNYDGAGGVIAVCGFWYDAKTKMMLEFDIVFDADEDWGMGIGNYYDIQNIATHEWGHTLVLHDLYATKYGAMTMFGASMTTPVYDWSAKYDIEKRSLGYGDALGIAELYPPSS